MDERRPKGAVFLYRSSTPSIMARPEAPRLADWLESARPFSLTASLVPVLVGAALAFGEGRPFDPLDFALVLIGGILLQVGTNMTNDVFDYRRGVDTKETPRASRVVIEGRLSPEKVHRGALAVFFFSLLLGLWLSTRVGPAILIPVALGIVGGYGYTAPPLEYKYRALGIPVVFVLMGPLMSWAAYLGNGGQEFWLPWVVALPVGFLVAAILHANDLRDFEGDRAARVITMTGVIGARGAEYLYGLMLFAPYVIILLVALTHDTSLWVLVTFLALPLAVTNWRKARTGGMQLEKIDQATAKLHLLFGLLFAAGLMVH